MAARMWHLLQHWSSEIESFSIKLPWVCIWHLLAYTEVLQAGDTQQLFAGLCRETCQSGYLLRIGVLTNSMSPCWPGRCKVRKYQPPLILGVGWFLILLSQHIPTPPFFLRFLCLLESIFFSWIKLVSQQFHSFSYLLWLTAVKVSCHKVTVWFWWSGAQGHTGLWVVKSRISWFGDLGTTSLFTLDQYVWNYWVWTSQNKHDFVAYSHWRKELWVVF